MNFFKNYKSKIKKILPQLLFIISALIVWQIMYINEVFPNLTFPSVIEIAKEFVLSFTERSMFHILGVSLGFIAKGLLAGIAIAFVFSGLAICFKSIYAIYSMLVAVFDLLPGVALLPIAIVWFGIGETTIIFLMVHSVVWPMSRSIIDGYNATPKIFAEVGKNIGLNKYSIILGVYIPASFPYIVSGFKVGWARAWRALISAEMIFGATSAAGGGIGYFIFLKRMEMNYVALYAALLVILVVGLVVEYGLFSNLEKRTIKKWGMVR